MIHALATLLLFQLAGEFIVRASALPVPGPVIGMVLLAVVLAVRGTVSEDLSSVSTTILRHLSLLFVPAGVGLILHFARIEAEWPAIAAALVVSSVLTLAVTAWVFRLCVRAGSGDAGGNG
ncbi:MAG: CidA/LrgA family protein [Rhodospirillaceae bacterium]